MSTALVAAIACAMASLNAAVRAQLDASVGTAHVRVQPAGKEVMPDRALGIIEAWEGVERIDARLERTLALVTRMPTLVERGDGGWVGRDTPYRVSAFVTGVDFESEFEQRPVGLIDGRYPTADDEVLIDAALARRMTFADAERKRLGLPIDVFADPAAYLDTRPVTVGETASDADEAQQRNTGVGVRVGDTVRVVRMFRERGELTVVGIAEPSPIGGKPFAIVTREKLGELAGTPDTVSRVDIVLRDGVDPDAFVARYEEVLGRNVLVQTTERITSGVEKNLRASQLGLVLIGAVALMCSGFIIMTGLTTGVAEQQRTLGVLRCLGATRLQVGAAQLLTGVLVGVLGAIAGVPLGVGMAAALAQVFEQQMPDGVVVPPVMMSVVLLGSIVSGVLGALWPAWRAATMSPLGALAARATPATARGVGRLACIALGMILAMIAIVLFITDSQRFFWSYISVGLPMMFTGYFLVSVPVVIVVSRCTGPLIARGLGIPAELLIRTVRATPYRHGFTAGALMTGLSLMIGIWTNGGSALRDWLDKIKFPDAFAYGLPLSDQVPDVIAELPVV
ncbi:MAG: FtsX-like permease family protein, partial [Planctomycetota bacterium]